MGRSAARSRNEDFELGDRRFEAGPSNNTAAVTTFYKAGGSENRSGSEEMILGDGLAKGGIMRTTEVRVS